MVRRFRAWRARRKLIAESGIYVYASRKTTFPLEQCTAENLRTGARFNRRRARTFSRRNHKQNHKASQEWNELAAKNLETLADKLEDGQTVQDLPLRKRRKEIEAMLRVSSGKAFK